MKSLEIVNNLINYMESVGETYDFTNISKKDCKQIKQDLEDYQELKQILKNHMILNDGFCGLHEERKYTFACKRVLSKKETKFLKQWLEENENE